jgi:hypothetical protein
MSNRKWKTEEGWEVVAGWDRALAGFFLMISTDCPNTECTAEVDPELLPEDCPTCKDSSGTLFLYNNLDDMTLKDKLGQMEYEEVEVRLKRYLTALPPSLLADLYADMDEDRRTEMTYPPAGRVRDVYQEV